MLGTVVGKVERRARRPWITQEIISKTDERRKWKNVINEEGGQKYTRLRKGLKKATEKAKKEFLVSLSNEIIEFQRRGLCKLMYMNTERIRLER